MYWSLLLNQHLTGLGFIRSKSDTSLYTYIGPDGEWCAIAVFVDDLLITGTSTAKIDELRTYLDRTFKGEGAWDECVNSFLGMRMSYNQKAGVLKMDVENKIDCFFEEHRDAFKGIRGIDAPYLKSFEDIDTPSDAPLSDVQKYIRDNFQHIAGTFIYWTITCRPDLATIINKACKGMHQPEVRHINYLEAAIKYAMKHRDLGLCYTRSGG